MDFTSIPYSHLPKAAPLFLDYIQHYDRVAQFYNGSPYDPKSYTALASRLRENAGGRAELAKILARQNADFGCGAATQANIKRLSEPGTFAVVTGQQVGLLSGPAFTLYKPLTAVRLAQSLFERGLPSVPVFWLATEDHDLEEVAQTSTFDDEYNLIELRDSGDRPAPHSHVGHVRLSGEINRTLERFESTLPPGEARDRLLEDLRESYQPGVGWGRAFGRFMAKIFSRWGVVLIDPLEDAVHRLCARVYEDCAARAADLRERLIERSKALVQAGYSAQVHVDDESTLLFMTREGNRTALRERGGTFSFDGNGTISAAELTALARERPLDFSPNVLLRPFVQDTLFPTIAYVAGPSELAYLAQSNVLYGEPRRPQPVIMPRAAFTLVDARIQRLLEKYRLSVEDAWQGEEHLRRAIAAAGFAEGWSDRLDETEQGVAQMLDRLRADIAAIDPTLLDTLKHTEEKMKHQIATLKGKISRAALQKSELLARHEEALLRFLLPRKQLQEREVTGAYFLGRAGYELLDRLLAQIRLDFSEHQTAGY